VLARAGLREEGIESIIAATNSFIRRHLTIGLDAVLKAEQFPASIANLNSSLSEMKAKNFTHSVS